MADKLTKASVDYGMGKPGSRCGICLHFVQSDSCRIVDGTIESHMWCKRFLKRGKSRLYAKEAA